MIRSESDVRSHVRDLANGKARWIEPNMGATNGLPDCWVPRCGKCVHIELKCGFLKDGILNYTVRIEQKKQLQLMKRDNVPCGLLIGIEGADVIVAARINAETLSGRLKLVKDSGVWMSVVPHKSSDWVRTLNFFMG